MENTVIVNRRKQIHKGRVFTLTTENITFNKGVTIDIDLIKHPGASAIVALTDKNEVVLIRQYRHAVGDFIWEIPAGALNPEENPETCARRELEEETGCTANKWKKMGEIVPVPGYSDERIHLFYATQLEKSVQNLDEDEWLSVHKFDFKEALRMVAEGEIVDAKTISGLLMANRLDALHAST